MACLVTCIFSLHYLNCLPFSGYTREFNYETVATLTSYLIYAQEPWSFPLGQIKSLTFPFEDANVGNVGALPLFAIIFKALGTAFDYFQAFDYFVLVDLLSCFGTALFAQKILLKIGVNRLSLRALGGLLTGTSLLLINRSIWLQPFCIVAGPIFLMWIYAMICFLERGNYNWLQGIKYIAIFPFAILLDGYSFFGIVLGTSALLIREIYEAYFGNAKNSWTRFNHLLFLICIGVSISYIALYIIGMYPMPKLAQTFTSYDFGMGGRYHVADLFTSFLPQSNHTFTQMMPSILGTGKLFPLTTDILSEGQYEGIAFIGTPSLFALVLYGFYWAGRKYTKHAQKIKLPYYRLSILSPWAKIFIGTLAVFIFSLGYELHVLGHPMSGFNLMPAAWLADRMPSLYNVRSTGRLASLLSFFLILEIIRRLSLWFDAASIGGFPKVRGTFLYPSNKQIHCLILFLTVLHLTEIFPFLKPVTVQPSHLMGGIFSEADVKTIERVSVNKKIVMLAPSVRAVGVEWEALAYGFVYYSKLNSNLYYLARTDPAHDAVIARDLGLLERGSWQSLQDQYGQNMLFVIPTTLADKLRSIVNNDYDEVLIGAISVWSKKE